MDWETRLEPELGTYQRGNGPDRPWEGGGEQMLSGGRALAGDLMKLVDGHMDVLFRLNDEVQLENFIPIIE